MLITFRISLHFCIHYATRTGKTKCFKRNMQNVRHSSTFSAPRVPQKFCSQLITEKPGPQKTYRIRLPPGRRSNQGRRLPRRPFSRERQERRSSTPRGRPRWRPNSRAERAPELEPATHTQKSHTHVASYLIISNSSRSDITVIFNHTMSVQNYTKSEKNQITTKKTEL